MNKKDLRIVFMGTPEFAVATLRALVEEGCNVVAVVTQPDKPVGRHGSTLQAPPVKQYAVEQGIDVLQPEKLRDQDFVEQLRRYEADLQVVVAYRMLPEVVWAMPKYGTFNVHASLLPHYRGAAPINWAVINGERQTGITTFFLDHEIDTGRMIMQETFDIPEDANVEYVYDGLMQLGADVCLRTLDAIAAADGHPVTTAQQEGDFEPAPKLFRETCQICWHQTARRVYDFVRGLSPYPGAWTALTMPDGRETTMKVLRATLTQLPPTEPGAIVIGKNRLCISATDGLLQIDELQIAGKRRMAAADFLNGTKDFDRWKTKD